MEVVRIGGGWTRPREVAEIGAKAAGLIEMANLGLPVPPAFVLPIGFCASLNSHEQETTGTLREALADGIHFLEEARGLKFGDRRRPLLVSVRSGAARSMPGMMDTLLNVGCTQAATRGLIRASGNPRFAWDCRRRFLESYAETIPCMDAALLKSRIDEAMQAEGAASNRDLDCEALRRLAAEYEQAIADAEGRLEDDAMAQLVTAVRSVANSWGADRARAYRRMEKLEALPGTAVTIQAMVFGNRGLTSAAGVAFSRNPSTGEPEPMVDVLLDSQGEDVVSGRRTPETEARIGTALPAALADLRPAIARLERHYRDAQDVEFTIEEGRLWILQTRRAKRTALAALRIAIDLVREGVIDEGEALRRLEGIDFSQLVVSRFADPGETVARGVGASGGVAVGRAAFDSASAERLASCGDPVVLVRPDMSTDDVAGLAVSAGIVTAAGGRTAHAALVARQKGKPCVVACGSLSVDAPAHRASLAGASIEEGDWLSVDGDAGSIFLGRHAILNEKPERELAEVNHWRERAVSRAGSSTGILVPGPH